MRNDELCEEVKIRLRNVFDLMTADGVFHHDYLQKFYLTLKVVKRRRPETDYVVEAVE